MEIVMKPETNEGKRPAIVVSNGYESGNGVMTFDVDGIGKLVLDTMRLDDDIRARAMYHGFEQKVRDAAAIGYKQKDGTIRRPTNQEKFDAMAEVVATLESGEWNKRREGTAETGLLFEALCRLYDGEHGKSKREPEAIRKWLDERDDKAKAGLRRLKQVADLMNEIRAERNPDAVEAAEELLDSIPE